MANQVEPTVFEKVVNLTKRRGFIFPASEIYGGFANSYTYGPYGVELKNNIKKLWWKTFVHDRADMVGIDGPIITHPKVWEASGHVTGFNDAMVDCKSCKKRYRADHLVEDATGKDLEGNLKGMDAALAEAKVKCPSCGKSNWTDVRTFNMMFKTEMNTVSDGESSIAYLRPETAGAIFIEFNNIMDTMRKKLPFGIAQIGKAFRNEIVAGNFIFRLREFEQMEIEYFINPNMKWEPVFESWLAAQEAFAAALGVKPEQMRRYEHPKEKLSFYSKKTIDVEMDFGFGGFKELFGLAHRSDYDLTQHAKFSGAKMEYHDLETQEKFVPHVIEPTFGLDRSVLAVLVAAYDEEVVKDETRVVMRFPKAIAPVQVAVLPLSKKDELSGVAHEVEAMLRKQYVVDYDETQSIGKRYRRQDEIGTPYCVTVDFDTLNDKAVTVRDRDTMEQERVAISELVTYLTNRYQS